MSEMRISNLWGKITVLVVICCCSLSAQAKYGGGKGEPNDPYQIRDANHMQAIGADSNDWDKHFKLMADIDLSAYTGTQFNVIGYWNSDVDYAAFTGVFDGNGHTISNFTYTSTGTETDCIGLFGFIGGWGGNAEIKDLGLIDPDVDGGTGDWVGSPVGWLRGGTITGCYVEGGSVAGEYHVGGLVGWNASGTITDCYSTTSVSGTNSVGGLVGYNDGMYSGATITNSYSEGDVSGTGWGTGGLVGYNDHGTITNCYSTGSVTGSSRVGGLVGWNFWGPISNCFWDIATSGQAASDGGTGLPTEDMQKMITFTNADWDFINVWNIGENQTYPYLRTVPVGDINKDRIVNFLDFAIIADQWLEEE